jgi:branched-chain amino acid transport system substrate-binding protein
MHIYQCLEGECMSSGNSNHKNRRDFLKTATAGGAVAFTGLSGCIGSTDDEDGGDGEDGSDGEDGDDGEDGGTTDDGPGFDQVTLGVLEPFTGDFAELASERNQGETLAIDQVNASDEYDFEFDIAEYDTQLSSEDGVQAAQQAIESDGAQFMTGAISSSVALAINEVAANNEVIYTPGAADVSITGSNCNEYVFRFETNTAQIAEVTTRWLADQGWTNLHYQIADYAYGDSVLNQVDSRMAAKSDDYEQLGTTRSDVAAQNFDSAITQIEENVDAADALIVGATGGHLIRFLVQAAERGLKEDIPIVTTTGSFRVVRGGAGPAAYDVYSGTRYVPSIDTGTNPQFVEDYQAEYDAPPDNFSRVGYGSVRMLANGIQEAGSKDPDDVKDVLPGMTHETIFGEVSFRECDQQASNPVWMGQNVAPEDGELADVELLTNLDGEEAQPPCEETGCEL